jgi:hypothetical protein
MKTKDIEKHIKLLIKYGHLSDKFQSDRIIYKNDEVYMLVGHIDDTLYKWNYDGDAYESIRMVPGCYMGDDGLTHLGMIYEFKPKHLLDYHKDN